MRISIILALSAIVFTGCQRTSGGGGGSDYMDAPIASKRGAIPNDALDRQTIGDPEMNGDTCILTRDVTFRGVLIKQGTHVYGLQGWADTEHTMWKIPMEFEELVGEKNMIFGRRFGSKMFVRLIPNSTEGQVYGEEPTSFTRVVVRHPWFGPGPSDGNDHWFGINDDQATITLLSQPDGRPIATYEKLSKDATMNGATTIDIERAVWLLESPGPFIVHFDGFDRMYSGAGQPMSPEVPPFWIGNRKEAFGHDLNEHNVLTIYALMLDEKKERLWPLHDDGSLTPRPDDCLGVQPIRWINPYAKTQYWRGWLVWWQTPAGERAAYMDTFAATKNYDLLIASKSDARWIEWQTIYDAETYSYSDIRKSAGATGYEVLHNDKPVAANQIVSTIGQGQALIAKTIADEKERTRLAEEELKRQQEVIRQAALKRIQEQQAAEARRIAKEQAEAIEDFDVAFKTNNQVMSRIALLKISNDPERWTKYVAKWGFDKNFINTSDSIGYARASLGGTDEQVLKEALKKAVPSDTPDAFKPAKAETPAWAQEPQSDWDYFWNGPRGGYKNAPAEHQGYQVDYRNTTEGVIEHLEQVRQQNLERWSRGEQSWGGPK